MRQTKQKETLNNSLKKMDVFFSAEELHQHVPTIGIATIYRFLNKSVKNGELHAYQCNRKFIYSSSKKNHSHFLCEKCAEVKHINLNKLDFLNSQIKGKVCHIQIDITGICEKCS